MKSGYLEGGASGRLPRIMDEDVAAKSNRWWKAAVTVKTFPTLYLRPFNASCHVALRDQSKIETW